MTANGLPIRDPDGFRRKDSSLERSSAANALVTWSANVARLEHFRNGDLKDESYCRNIIDIVVRAVFIFDDKYYITQSPYSA